MRVGRRRAFAARLNWLAVLVWAGLIWFLVTLPEKDVPDIRFLPLKDKLGHAAVFCIWGILLFRAADGSFRFLSRTGLGAMCVVAVTVYGSVVEVYQAQTGRDAEFLDIAADIAGAIAAYYLFFSPKVNALLKKPLRRRVASAIPPSRAVSAPTARPKDASGRESPKAEDAEP